jgi:hypothetical protein
MSRNDARVRMLGIVGAVTAIAYLITPQYLLGGFGRPFFFKANLRYSSPALAIGLLLLPIVLRKRRSLILLAYALTLLVTVLDPTSLPTGVPWAVFQDRVTGSDSARAVVVLLLALTVAGVAVALRRRMRYPAWITPVALSLAVLLGLAMVHDSYLEHRYTDTSPYENVYRWARRVHDERIAVVGLFMQGQYPVAGLDLSNRVQYAGIALDDGGFRPARTCDEWASFLEDGSYDYVVVAPSKNYDAWTATQPNATIVLTDQFNGHGPVVVHVYRLDGHRRSRSC